MFLFDSRTGGGKKVLLATVAVGTTITDRPYRYSNEHGVVHLTTRPTAGRVSSSLAYHN